jgi:hypothetical protein
VFTWGGYRPPHPGLSWTPTGEGVVYPTPTAGVPVELWPEVAAWNGIAVTGVLDYGDGSTTTLQPGFTGSGLLHTFSLPGTYTLTLSLRDALGGTASTTLALPVGSHPTLGIAPAHQPEPGVEDVITVTPQVGSSGAVVRGSVSCSAPGASVSPATYTATSAATVLHVTWSTSGPSNLTCAYTDSVRYPWTNSQAVTVLPPRVLNILSSGGDTTDGITFDVDESLNGHAVTHWELDPGPTAQYYFDGDGAFPNGEPLDWQDPAGRYTATLTLTLDDGTTVTSPPFPFTVSS